MAAATVAAGFAEDGDDLIGKIDRLIGSGNGSSDGIRRANA
jgi:hypothetical protein